MLDLLESRRVNTSLDAVCLLRSTGGLQHHLSSHGVDLGEGNAIKLGDVLDKRLQLKRVPVGDRGDNIRSPLLNKTILQNHRIRHIIVNVRVVRGILPQEPLKLKSILDGVDLRNV